MFIFSHGNAVIHSEFIHRSESFEVIESIESLIIFMVAGHTMGKDTNVFTIGTAPFGNAPAINTLIR